MPFNCQELHAYFYHTALQWISSTLCPGKVTPGEGIQFWVTLLMEVLVYQSLMGEFITGLQNAESSFHKGFIKACCDLEAEA